MLSTGATVEDTGNSNTEIPSGYVAGEILEEPEAPSEPTPATEPEPQAASEPVHEHMWVAVEETIYHEAEGHYETVVTQEAWEETIEETIWRKAVLEDGECNILSGQGVLWHDLDACKAWIYSHSFGEFSNTRTNYSIDCPQIPVVVTNTIYHDAVTAQVWVEDKPA